MEVKIDTREKFTTITPASDFLSDTLTEQLVTEVAHYLTNSIKNIVLNMKEVKDSDPSGLEKIADLQQRFCSDNHSFVICELQPKVLEKLHVLDIADTMNITPTESEAWDILQMEELERELMNDEDLE